MKQKTDYQKQKSNSSSNLFQKGLFYFALVIFLGLTCWVFFFSGLLQIKKINFKEGISDEERSVFEKVIKEELKGSFLEFIPRNNLVLINCEKIEKKLEKQSKSIKKVVVSKKFPDELILELTIREGQFIFCVQEKCFLVDNMGEAYFQLDNLELDEFKNSLAEIRLKGQRTIGVGERIISSEKAQIYSQLAGLSEREPEFGFKNIFWLNSLAAREIEMETEAGWKIIFSTEEPIEKQLKILEKVLENEIGDKRDQLEYIDLRVKEKVFYRLKSNSEKEGA